MTQDQQSAVQGAAASSRTPLLGKGHERDGTVRIDMNGAAMSSRPSEPASDSRRMVVFGMAVLCGLASGSNYVYSAYAPQLASELAISSTQINLIGTAGNLGMYLSGPVVGRYVDAHGPRIPLLVGGTLNFVGYNMVRMFFQHTIAVRATPAGPVSSLRLGLLAFAMFMTGVGGSAGLSASVNVVAKSFPDRTRASATGTVLAGFGLSAFLFSTVGHALFEGDAGGLLLLLALGTGLPSIIGSFVVRAVPPAAAQSSAAAGYQPVSIGPDIVVVDHSRVSIDQTPYSRSSSLEMSRSRSPASRQRHHPLAHEIQSSHRDDDREDAAGGSEISFTKPFDGSADDDERMGGIAHALPPHLTPHELLRSKDFYTLFTVLALCCGTGLMYINNAGTVALALGRMGKLVYDTKRVASYQAKQVAIVSIWNCTGRIVGGLVSDMAKMKLGIKRIWFLPVVASLFIISQLTALHVTAVEHLWLVSTLLGLAYGSLFNVIPMLVLEWFGMPHFSQNYGWTCVAPVIGGNIFNLIFGRVYDAHTIGRIGEPSSSTAGMLLSSMIKRGGVDMPDDRAHACLIGEDCYGNAFRVSTLACCIALVLSLWAGIRKEREARQERKV